MIVVRNRTIGYIEKDTWIDRLTFRFTLDLHNRCSRRPAVRLDLVLYQDKYQDTTRY